MDGVYSICLSQQIVLEAYFNNFKSMFVSKTMILIQININVVKCNDIFVNILGDY